MRWSKRAERDLDEIAAYIGIDSPPAAARVILELIEQTEALSIQPAIGRAGRVAGTREFIIAGLPYIIPYRVRGNDVELLRVLHTSRRWPEDI
ncbi:MAG: type II toxin-antitoxin system RelE/ParE family toxin [Burkholderiales bacterium]